MKKMNVLFTSLLLLIGIVNATAQATLPDDYMASIKAYQQKLNEEYHDKENSPLKPKDRKQFSALNFYPIDTTYRVVANFVRTSQTLPFKMATSTDRKPVYEKYGELHFTLKGKKITLPVYRSHQLRSMPEYRNHLFLPFTDLTNGETTYGGGRYLDVEIPEGTTMIVDFNKAYNPYCAYNYNYSCPIPPKANHLPIAIEAGVKSGYQKK